MRKTVKEQLQERAAVLAKRKTPSLVDAKVQPPTKARPARSAPKIDLAPEVQAAAKALSPAVARLRKALAALRLDTVPLGSLADLLYDLNGLGRLLSTLSAPFDDLLGPKCKEIEDHFVAQLSVGESSGVQGRYSRVQVAESVVPTVEDWEKFYAYIGKNKAFELLNRAVNRKAVQERWDVKKQVPGVGRFHVKKVSCTKLGGK